jgi:hypothetical protein
MAAPGVGLLSAATLRFHKALDWSYWLAIPHTAD